MKSIFAIGWLLTYISIASVSAAIITPALPNIQRHFALSSDAITWVVSLFLLGYVLGQLIYGPLSNVYGRLKALRLGLMINLLGLIICLVATFTNSFFLLNFGRFLTGLGTASGLVCTFILINEWRRFNSTRTHASLFCIIRY